MTRLLGASEVGLREWITRNTEVVSQYPGVVITLLDGDDELAKLKSLSHLPLADVRVLESGALLTSGDRLASITDVFTHYDELWFINNDTANDFCMLPGDMSGALPFSEELFDASFWKRLDVSNVILGIADGDGVRFAGSEETLVSTLVAPAS